MIPFKLLFDESIRIQEMDEDDLTISEVLQTIYPFGEESSISIIWNNYSIELNLSAQIADVYSDIIKMLNHILITEDNEFDVFWGSSSFMAQWKFIRHENSQLKINAFWTSIAGGKAILDDLQNVSSSITIDISSFVEEWIALLICLRKDIISAGYNTDDLEDFEEMVRILDFYFD